MAIKTNFKLKPQQKIEFKEGDVEFKIKNKGEKYCETFFRLFIKSGRYIR